MTPSRKVRYLLRFVALVYVGLLLIVPVSLILWRSFAPGFGQFFAYISTPAAISALQLSLLVVAIVVPLNVIFGIPTALVLARNRFRGKGALQAATAASRTNALISRRMVRTSPPGRRWSSRTRTSRSSPRTRSGRARNHGVRACIGDPRGSRCVR